MGNATPNIFCRPFINSYNTAKVTERVHSFYCLFFNFYRLNFCGIYSRDFSRQYIYTAVGIFLTSSTMLIKLEYLWMERNITSA